MKRRLSALLISLVVIISISGCNKAGTPIITTTTVAETTVTEETATATQTMEETTAETTTVVQTTEEVTETTTSGQIIVTETETTVKTEEVTTTAVTTTAETTTTTTVAAITSETTTNTETVTTTTEVTTAEETTADKAATVNTDYELKLSNPDASGEAVRLFEYICETYKNGIISGQQESTWKGSDQYEFEYIYDKTGKYPAIRGLDYMNDDFRDVNKRAIEWYERGGIVTICWHCGSDFSGSWAESMNTEITDWDKALAEGTPEYEKLIKGMDKGAKALQELEDKNIPVLWRPFHELDGAWFWWGKGGAGNFKKLWVLMYDRYTNYWGLDNLIWVLGYSGNGRGYEEWYPGNEYVDIAGADSYNDGANAGLYRRVQLVVGDEMPICFHECGRIPTVEQLKKKPTNWVWFMTWHTDHITGHNDITDLKDIYNDEYVITLDELPDLY